jgi:hypothetical protein
MHAFPWRCDASAHSDTALLCNLLYAAPQAFVYESNVSKATYLFNNSHVSMADAHRSCAENGGHLAAFK